MNTYVLWIEMNQAKIFNISRNGVLTQILKRKEIKHHTNADPENHKDCEKFFHQIAESIEGAEEILLFGPSLTKDHFKNHLTEHHHPGLAKAVIGVRTLDRMSDEKLLDQAHDFFKDYATFGSQKFAN